MTDITFKNTKPATTTITGSYFGAEYKFEIPEDSTVIDFFRTVLAAYATEGYQNAVSVTVYGYTGKTTTLTFHRDDGIRITEP